MHTKKVTGKTDLEDFESSDIKDTDERSSLALGSVQRFVDTGNKPFEETLIDCLANCFNCKFNLEWEEIYLDI